jgi:large conductance mechanosensitive channel
MSIGSLWGEFKSFAFKGNVIDLAVAFVIGVAFGAVITSFVGNIVMPLVSYVLPAADYRAWTIGRVEIGVFIGALINFLVIAAAVFLVVVKGRQALSKPKAAAPATRECPACAMDIPAKAVRCPHCTSDLAGGSQRLAA